MATRWRTPSTPARAAGERRRAGDVAGPDLDAAAPPPAAVQHDLRRRPACGRGRRRDGRRRAGPAGVAADEAAGTGDEDGGHGDPFGVVGRAGGLRRRARMRRCTSRTRPRAGIVASGHADAPSRAARGDAQGRAPPPSRRLAPDRHRARARAHARASMPRATWPGMSRGAHRADAVPDQAELLRAFDLPIALMQDAEALERITAELVETKAADGVRYVEIRWGPLLHVARRAARWRTGSRAVCAGAAAAAERTGTVVRLICTALRSHDPAAQRDARRDGGPVPRPGPDRLGPRRARGGLPGPAASTPGRSRPPGPAACASPSTPASGAARRRSGAPSRWTRSGSPTARAPSTTRRCAPSSIDPGVTLDLCPTSNWQAGIVPSRRRRTRSPGSHRMGVPVTLSHRRHDRLRHHACPRSTPNAIEPDRADAARAVGHRPARARRRLRRRGDARAGPRRVRRVGAGIPELAASAPDAATLRPRRESPSEAAAASSAASAATAVGRSSGGSASTWARVVTPVSIRMQRRRRPRAAARSVPIPSPIIIASCGVAADRLGRELEQLRRGLPIDSGTTPVVASSAAAIAPGAGPQAALGRVDRVAVGGDEPRAGADAIGGGREPQVGQVRVEAGRRPRPARRRRPSRRCPPGASASRRAPAVTTSSPTSRSSRSRPPAPRTSTRRIARLVVWRCGAPSRGPTTRRSGRDRRAHRRQAGHVVGAVVHRVVRDVDDVVARARRGRRGRPRRPGTGSAPR